MNKVELVKILEIISRDKGLDPDEAMKLTEHLLELFRQKPIIREVPTPYLYPHYPMPPTTFCYTIDIIPASQDMPDPTLSFLD